jgi:hypothetical protein
MGRGENVRCRRHVGVVLEKFAKLKFCQVLSVTLVGFRICGDTS